MIKTFTDYSQTVDDFYKDLEIYNTTIAEFFMRGRKHNISVVFIPQSYFAIT